MRPLPNSVQKIIIAPLNWGLGHATRCIPIINYYLDQGIEVVIASDGEALALLKEAFPKLKTVTLPAYNVTYKGGSLFKIVFYNAFRILKAIIKEHLLLQKLIQEIKPDLIISDSRFGCATKKVRSIFITHQLNLQSNNRIFKVFLNLINAFFLKQFDEIWVPDTAQHTLSGKLSQSIKFDSVYFINPISRLTKLAQPIKYDLAIILSGPEPARTKLESLLVKKLATSHHKVILIRGTNMLRQRTYPKHWIIENRINADALNVIISSSDKIISRSGYTSIMDYYLLQKGALLIPTPGQTEQEYLGRYLDGKYGFSSIDQKDLNSDKLYQFIA